MYALAPGGSIAAHREAGGVIHTYVQLARDEEWFAQIDFSDADASSSRIAAEFEGWAPELRALITDGDTPPVVRLIHALPDDHSWTRTAGVTLIGDAAHLMPPSGEGANLAMLDGAELARALAAHPEDMDAALLAFEQAMFARSLAEAPTAHVIQELCVGPRAPHAFVEFLGGHGVDWVPAWGQAVSDHRGEDDEPGFVDTTVRMIVPASVGGDRVRAQLSNRFADAPVRIGRAAIGVAGRFRPVTFDGRSAVEIPAGMTAWTDPVDLAVEHGDDVMVDLYLPDPTPYATAAGFRFDRFSPGDHTGAVPFPGTTGDPDAEPAGSDWSLPAGGPLLRSIEVAGTEPRAVIVALGSSSTAMGWPQYAAELLPDDARIAIVNRGIPGNRLLADAPPQAPSWGRAGLARFGDDVLGTAGATHVVIAYNSNDWGLPGHVTPIDELPTLDRLIDGYRQLIDRAEAAGIAPILATVTPLGPDLRADPSREAFRQSLNDWIRTSGLPLVDFDAALRSAADPIRLSPEYAAPDDTHPNIDGSKRLARAMIDGLTAMGL
jgi:lysophospholipase L1-like esterase